MKEYFYSFAFLNFTYLWMTFKKKSRKSLFITNAIMTCFVGILAIASISLFTKLYPLLVFEIIWITYVYNTFKKGCYREYYKKRIVKRNFPNKWFWVLTIDGVALMLLLAIARTMNVI